MGITSTWLTLTPYDETITPMSWDSNQDPWYQQLSDNKSEK